MHTPLRLLATLVAVTLLATANAQATQALDWILRQQDVMLEFGRFSTDLSREYRFSSYEDTLNLDLLGPTWTDRALALRDQLNELGDEYDALAPSVRSLMTTDDGYALQRAFATGMGSVLNALHYLTSLQMPEGLTYQQHRSLRQDIEQWSEMQWLWLTIRDLLP